MDDQKQMTEETVPASTDSSTLPSTSQSEKTQNHIEKKRKLEPAVSPPEVGTAFKQSRQKIEDSHAEETKRLCDLNDTIKKRKYAVRFLESGLSVLKEEIGRKTEEMENSKKILLMLTEVLNALED